jgi:hypothetical protein
MPTELFDDRYETDRDAIGVGASAGLSGRSVEEPVEKTAAYFRSLPVTARLRSNACS